MIEGSRLDLIRTATGLTMVSDHQIEVHILKDGTKTKTKALRHGATVRSRLNEHLLIPTRTTGITSTIEDMGQGTTTILRVNQVSKKIVGSWILKVVGTVSMRTKGSKGILMIAVLQL